MEKPGLVPRWESGKENKPLSEMFAASVSRPRSSDVETVPAQQARKAFGSESRPAHPVAGWVDAEVDGLAEVAFLEVAVFEHRPREDRQGEGSLPQVGTCEVGLLQTAAKEGRRSEG